MFHGHWTLRYWRRTIFQMYIPLIFFVYSIIPKRVHIYVSHNSSLCKSLPSSINFLESIWHSLNVRGSFFYEAVSASLTISSFRSYIISSIICLQYISQRPWRQGAEDAQIGRRIISQFWLSGTRQTNPMNGRLWWSRPSKMPKLLTSDSIEDVVKFMELLVYIEEDGLEQLCFQL